MDNEEEAEEISSVSHPLEFDQILDRLCRKDGQIISFAHLIEDHVVLLAHVGQNRIWKRADPVLDLVGLRTPKLLGCLIFCRLIREDVSI